jgi:hypothetical protein
MFHSGTRRLIDYWRSLSAQHGSAPIRSDFDPAELGELLPHMFVLSRAAHGPAFRLAGEAVIDLHGRPLVGETFAGLWSPGTRGLALRGPQDAIRNACPVIIAGEARSDMGEASLEIVVAPLASPQGPIDRLVGLYQPTTTLSRLQGRPVIELAARLCASAALTGIRAAPRLAALDGRRIA